MPRTTASQALVGSTAPVPAAPPKSSRPPRDGRNTTALLAVINDALAGVGSVYLTTRSVLVTLIAALCAVILAGLALLAR